MRKSSSKAHGCKPCPWPWDPLPGPRLWSFGSVLRPAGDVVGDGADFSKGGCLNTSKYIDQQKPHDFPSNWPVQLPMLTRLVRKIHGIWTGFCYVLPCFASMLCWLLLSSFGPNNMRCFQFVVPKLRKPVRHNSSKCGGHFGGGSLPRKGVESDVG